MLQSKPQLVSIAVTTYNGECFLQQQLDSLVQQTYRPLEIVVGDDCSSDRTMEILRRFESNFPETVHIFQNEKNLGYVKNFEKVLLRCNGDYIALCDQDDVWCSNKIELLLDGIDEYDLVHSDARLLDESGNIIANSYSEYARKVVDDYSFLTILIKNSVTGCTSLIRRELAERATPFPSCIPHDHWIALLAADGNGINYQKETLIDYRQHSGNAIGAQYAETTIHFSSLVQKQLYSWRLNQRNTHRHEMQVLEALKKIGGNRITSRSMHHIKELYRYHSSYFIQRVRLWSFLYHLKHFFIFNTDKDFLTRSLRLISSLYGELKNI